MKNLALMMLMLVAFACGGNGDGEEVRETETPKSPGQAVKRPWHLARSAEGKFLCEVIEVLPSESPVEDGAGATIAYLEFAFPETGMKTIFDRDVRVPRAIRPDGENRAGRWLMTPLLVTPRGVSIPDLDLGQKVDRVALLQVDAVVAHVLDEKEFSFEDLGLGESEKLSCRAFELVVTGESEHCTVLAQAFPEFAEVRAEYHMVVPPTVATHQWGMHSLRVYDSAGNRLEQRGGGGGEDRTSGNFVLRDPDGDGVLPLVYPVTVKIRIPTRVRMENVVFQFKNIPMAPYQKK